jgi:hypothetical protein
MKVGFGCKICLRTGSNNWGRRERGMCTRERDTGRRETVTLEDGSAMMEEQKKEEGIEIIGRESHAKKACAVFLVDSTRFRDLSSILHLHAPITQFIVISAT